MQPRVIPPTKKPSPIARHEARLLNVLLFLGAVAVISLLIVAR